MKKLYIILAAFVGLYILGAVTDDSTAQNSAPTMGDALGIKPVQPAPAPGGTQQPRSAWRIISGESLASGRWQQAYTTNGNQQMRFDYISRSNRPANAEDFYSFSIYLWNGDSHICGYGVDNTITVYYRIDNGATGRVSAMVRDNREYVRFSINASGPYTRTIPDWRGIDYSAHDVDSFVRDLRRGQRLTVQTIDSCGTDTTFSFDLTGFSRVIDQEING